MFPQANGLNVLKYRRFSFQLRYALCIKLPSVCSEIVSLPSSEFKTGHLAHLHFIAINRVILEGKSIAFEKSFISDGESNQTCRSEPLVQSLQSARSPQFRLFLDPGKVFFMFSVAHWARYFNSSSAGQCERLLVSEELSSDSGEGTTLPHFL